MARGKGEEEKEREGGRIPERSIVEIKCLGNHGWNDIYDTRSFRDPFEELLSLVFEINCARWRGNYRNKAFEEELFWIIWNR